jgi:hypothetical protein
MVSSHVLLPSLPQQARAPIVAVVMIISVAGNIYFQRLVFLQPAESARGRFRPLQIRGGTGDC